MNETNFIDYFNNLSVEEQDKIKDQLLLRPLESLEELQAWMYVFFGVLFPCGTVHSDSTHGPADAMWRIYELFKTGENAHVPQVTILSSRDSYKTLAASAIEVLCLMHFRFSVAHAAAILSQSEKAVQYANDFFNKVKPYLEKKGWEKTSDNKTKIEWKTDTGETIYLRVLVMTMRGMNCISGDSIVDTNLGTLTASILYDKICNGEKVSALSFNHDNDKLEYQPIVCAEENKSQFYYEIETNYNKLTVSPGHKIFIKGRGYIEADKVKKGDVVIHKKYRILKDDKV